MPIAGGMCFAVGRQIIVLGGYTSGRRPQSKVEPPEGGHDVGDHAKFLPFTAEPWWEVPPKAEKYAFGFSTPMTDESWSLDTTSGLWKQLASAPQAHDGYSLYLAGAYIRSAADPR